MCARVPERPAFKGKQVSARGYTSASARSGTGTEQTGVSRSSMRARVSERLAFKVSAPLFGLCCHWRDFSRSVLQSLLLSVGFTVTAEIPAVVPSCHLVT
ncbi:hypothetical protein NDU88_004076 [Pleurodeles waltl]|uniref:Uncharacterized protein n=1 Tax=Pleurodeles waltl TaxID=8319 RepID=A0AAV7UH28_PLEWA|nr:hypothetical protein NDU88_004076 [Pleurodeles waltl]